jgi:hypothetical protein
MVYVLFIEISINDKRFHVSAMECIGAIKKLYLNANINE